MKIPWLTEKAGDEMKNKSQGSVRQNREDQAAGLVIKSIYLSSFSQNQMTTAWNTQVKGSLQRSVMGVLRELNPDCTESKQEHCMN